MKSLRYRFQYRLTLGLPSPLRAGLGTRLRWGIEDFLWLRVGHRPLRLVPARVLQLKFQGQIPPKNSAS